jgi:putative peptidoglycan lipid II flippase
LFKSIFTNSTGILVSRVLGFIRDLLMASVIGANIYSDIFFVAFKLPNLFRRIFAEGAFTQAFLPSFAAARHKAHFTSFIALSFLSIIVIISIFVSLFSTLVTKAIAVGFDNTQVELAADFVAINFYYLDFIFLVSLLATLLQYKNHFATTAYSTALLNISMIASLLLSSHLDKIYIVEILSYGVLLGGLMQLAVHIIMIERLNLSRVFTVGIAQLKKPIVRIKEDTKRFYKAFVPSVLGNSTMHISAFLDTWLASFLISGSISYLYYSNRVFQLPLALFAIATSIALFPVVAKAIKKENFNEAIELLSKSFWLLLILLSNSYIIGVLFAQEIIWLLFERGEFTHNDTVNASKVLFMYLIGLIPYGLHKIFSLWLYATHNHSLSAKITAKSLGVNIVLSLILIYPLGAVGLALASSLTGFVLLHLTIKSFGYINFKYILYNKRMTIYWWLSMISVVVFSSLLKYFIS